MERARTIAFWTTTVIIAAVWLGGGWADLLRQPGTVEGMRELGYPAYVLTILGFWKVLGAVAIVVPGFPRLKEWAYAGTFFELTGAMASHVAAHSSAVHLVWTGLFALCTLVSWALRPAGRTIGELHPTGTRLAGVRRTSPDGRRHDVVAAT